jgi:hypothetical protein
MRILQLLVVLVPLTTPVAAKEQTLVFDDPEWEVYTLTFDDTRISATAVRKLAWLSPDMPDVPGPFMSLRGENGNEVDRFLAPPDVNLCNEFDPAYKNCKANRPGSPTFFRNAAVNITKGREQESRLARMWVPNELLEVKRYLLATLQLYLSVERAELAYLKTGNAGILAPVTEKLCGRDPDPALLSKLGGTGSQDEKFHVAHYEWHNLVNQCILARKGRYPIADWKKFVSDYGITERHRFRRVD